MYKMRDDRFFLGHTMDEEKWGEEMSFEFIDWNEIADAEFSGDQEAVDRLM